MKSNWTYTVNEDAQVNIDFSSRDGEISGGVTFSREHSLTIAMAVLDRRPDVDPRSEILKLIEAECFSHGPGRVQDALRAVIQKVEAKK